MMIRIAAIVLALAGVFAFPWPLAAAFAMVAALFFPPVALVAGVLTDILYYSPGAYPVPLATLVGVLAFIIAYLVHGFVKTRIMGA